MAKIDYRELPSGERRKMVQELAQMLLAVKEERDMVQVLYRLLTPSEQVMLGRRKQVAEMLVEGATYHSIQEKLRVSVQTIRGIEKWLEDAVRDFDLVRREQRRQARDEEFRKNSRRRQEPGLPGSFTSIRRRYGGRFLLLNLLLDGFSSPKD